MTAIVLSLRKTTFVEVLDYKGGTMIDRREPACSLDAPFDSFRVEVLVKRGADLRAEIDRFAEAARKMFPRLSFSIHAWARDRKFWGFNNLVDDKANDPLGLDRHVNSVKSRGGLAAAAR